ncbi:hypothetical protein V1511DRAFT_95870 [Dipodascopsis uninucleata]
MTGSKVLRMGIAGCGRMGQIHVENMIDTRFIQVTAVCSVVKSELEWAKNNVEGIATFEDYDEFIKSDVFDAVLIVTPSALHAQQVKAALTQNKHVFCEKPICSNAVDAWELYYETLKYPHLKVCCGFPRRYAKPYVEARKRIANGDIGEVMTIRSQTTDLYARNDFMMKYIATSGGIFVDCCIHDIDACLYLIGKDKTPDTAYGTGTTNVFPEFKAFGDVDDGMGIITFKESDVIMNVYGSRDNRHGHHSMTEVIGTKGRLLINGEPRLISLEISDENGTRMEGPASHMEIFGYAFKLEIEAFRDWILEDKAPNFNLKDAAKAVSIGSALMESLRGKKIAEVKLY